MQSAPRLLRLEVERLRNLEAVALDVAPGVSVVHGRNGHGKTSLLEAVYLLATGRSFRTRRIEEMVNRGGGPLRVAGTVRKPGHEARLGVVVDGAVRRLVVDGTERGLEGYLGHLPVVAIAGRLARVLREAPEERRRFLDRGVASLEPSFLGTLAEYRRSLAHRNALLRSFSGRDDPARRAEMAVWDERLTSAAAPVHRKRREYALRLGARLGEAARVLFFEGERLTLGYRPSPSEAGRRPAVAFEETYREALERQRRRDMAFGFTTEGPHRDEFVAELDGIDLRRYGSSGQVRAAMIALSLGKIGLVREARGEAPLVLVDDFDSDLDEARTDAFASCLRAEGLQALVATSREAVANGLGDAFRKVRVNAGRVADT